MFFFQRNPPPAQKKAKVETKKGGNEGKSSPKEDQKWALDKTKYVSVNEFRGTKLIDIRMYYEKNGQLNPGKKGISLSVQAFKALLDQKDEILASVGAE